MDFVLTNSLPKIIDILTYAKKDYSYVQYAIYTYFGRLTLQGQPNSFHNHTVCGCPQYKSLFLTYVAARSCI